MATGRNSVFGRIRHEWKLATALSVELVKTQRRNMRRAKQDISKLDELHETEKKKLLAEYRKDYARHRMKFSEWYYSYRFQSISEEEKKEYMSQRDYASLWRKYKLLYPEQSVITGKKQVFLEKYAQFVRRRWLYVDAATNPEEIQKLLDSTDVIVKPTNACSGKGVHKISRGAGTAQDVLRGRLPALVEECVQNVEELAAFHPASLNTVRITTLTDGKTVRILGACLRTGNNNSVFDNADAGGYFAEIDAETGVIVSDGITEWGVQAAAHPASGKVFRGTQIPCWDAVLDVVNRATLHLENTYLIAWDIAVTPEGIDMIEGNSIPSMEVHQMPLHRGVRRKLYSILDELHMPYKDAVRLNDIISRLIRVFA